MGERQKPKKNGREEKANSKKNHRIGDFDSSCSGTAFCLFLSSAFFPRLFPFPHFIILPDLFPVSGKKHPITSF